MKKILLGSSLFALVACSTVDNPMRISTTLRTQEFNVIITRYMEQATLVSAEKMPDGKYTLMVRVQTTTAPHARDNPGLPVKAEDSVRFTDVRFSKKNAKDYVAAIDKFAKWADLAIQRKDLFEKEIGVVPTWAATGSGSLKFTFHSGNDQAYYLVITSSSSVKDLGDQALSFDTANAQELKRLLQAFAADSLQKTDINRLYK